MTSWRHSPTAIKLERGCDGEHYVIATGQGAPSRRSLSSGGAEETFRLTGRRVEIRHVPEPPDLHPIERRNFVGDSRLFRSASGWRPNVKLAAGIRDYLARTGKLSSA